MRPRIASPLVTTRAPTFFARNQSAALLMLASGVMVATSVPFCRKMLWTVIAVSPVFAVRDGISVHVSRPVGNADRAYRDAKRRPVAGPTSPIVQGSTGRPPAEPLCARHTRAG